MKQISPQRLFVPEPTPCGLWSLRDMLDRWGQSYMHIGAALAYAETRLEDYRRETGGAVAGHGTSTIDPEHEAVNLLLHKYREATKRITDQDLEPIGREMRIMEAGIMRSQVQKPNHLPIFVNDLIDHVRRMQRSLLVAHEYKFFYYLKPGYKEFYGNPALFGESVSKKFPAAINDIEWAGNCLALGQPTACVLHLNRAMEIALRRIAGKLKGVTVGPKDAMGDVLRNMAAPIRDLPAKTNAQKRKKELWAECVLNLSHVKTAWRDPGSHGRQSYDETQARDILERVKGFMQQLATLL